jgi:hypothetical protein
MGVRLNGTFAKLIVCKTKRVLRKFLNTLLEETIYLDIAQHNNIAGGLWTAPFRFNGNAQ